MGNNKEFEGNPEKAIESEERLKPSLRKDLIVLIVCVDSLSE